LLHAEDKGGSVSGSVCRQRGFFVACAVPGILCLLGHVVTTVSNGEDAIRALNHFTPDAILMDMQMPHMVGGPPGK